jgi:broad specificity phosphatase PhoE
VNAGQRVYLLRHGHSVFQTTYEVTGIDPGIVDAPLSDLGVKQVRELASQVSHLGIDLIVTSPLTRAIETAIGLFGGRPAAPVIVNALMCERLGDSCDIGRPASFLSAEFPLLDFSDLPERWWYEGPKDARGVPVEPRDLFSDRVTGFRKWLSSRRERIILVVSHSGFIASLCGARLANCELYEWDNT